MEVKIFGKKANRQALSGALALLIAAGSVTPAADTFGAGVSTKAYAEAGDTAGSEVTDLEQAKTALETAINAANAAIESAADYLTDNTVAEKKATLESALETANTAKDSEVLETVQNATTALTEATTALTEAVDQAKNGSSTEDPDVTKAKEDLSNAIAAANEAKTAADNYKEDETVSAKITELETAIGNADNVKDSTDVNEISTTTDSIKAATEALNNAVSGAAAAKELSEANEAYKAAETEANAAIASAGDKYAASEVDALKAAMAEEATTAEKIKTKTENVKTLTTALNNKIAEEKAAETVEHTVVIKAVTNSGLDEVENVGASTAKYEGGKIIVTAAEVEGYKVTGYKFTIGGVEKSVQESNEYAEAIDTSEGDVEVTVEVVYAKETSELDAALVAYDEAVASANSMINVAKNSDYKDVEAVKTAITAVENARGAEIDKTDVEAVKAQTTAIENATAALDLAVRVANRADLLTKADAALEAAEAYKDAAAVKSAVEKLTAAKDASEKADTTDVTAVEETNKGLNNAIVALNDAVKAAQNAEYTLSFTVSPDSLANDCNLLFEKDGEYVTTAKYGDVVTVYYEESLEGYSGSATYGDKHIANGDTITVTADVKLVVEYTAERYALTASSADDKIVELGKISPFAAYGEKISISAELIADGYEALAKENISVKSGKNDVEFTFEGGNISFTMPDGAVSVTVSVPEKTQYTIKVTSDNEYTVLVDGKPYSETADEEAGTTVNKPVVGSTVKIVPAAADGKTAKVTVDAIAEEDITTGEDGSVTFTAPAANITASIAYEDIKYAVTAAENTKGEVAFTEGVDEDGKSTIGTEVKFTVTAGSAYEVRTVCVNGEAVEAGDDGSYSYTMTAAAAEVTVEYGLKTFALTIANNANVTGTEVSIVCADNAENTDTEHVHAGDVVTLKPTTKEGYSVNIVNYVIAGKTVKATETEDGYTFTVPEDISGDVTVRYTSGVTKFKVTCDRPEAIETVDVPDTVNYGKSLTINVTPAGGYQVDAMYYVTADGEIEFTKNNTSENGAGEYVIANVYADGALKFVTSAREYSITNNAAKTEDDKDGWVEIIDKARTGDVVTVTVTSGEGYQYIPEAGSTLRVTYVDNQTQETTAVELTPVEDTLNTYTFKMPNGEVTVDCTFTMISYEIINEGTDALAVTVTDETPDAHNFGEEMTVKYQEENGYVYTLKITGKTSGKEIEVTESKFTMPSEDIEVVLTREAVKYAITDLTAAHVTLSAVGEDSKVPASGDTFTVESPVKFKAEAVAGYENVAVTYKTVEGENEEGEIIYSEPKTVEAVEGVYTISATKPVKIEVTAAAMTYSIASASEMFRDDSTLGEYNEGSRGSVDVPGSAATDSKVELTVTPNEGYAVESVEYTYTLGEEEKTGKAVLNDETGKYEFTMPAAQITGVTIKYAAVRRIVTIKRSNCDVQGETSNVQVNTTVTYTLVPDENYRINKNNISITCEDRVVTFELTGNELMFVMPNGDVVLTITPTAEYEVSADDIMGGVVTFKNNTTAGEDTEFTKTVMAIDGDEIEIKVEDAEGYSHTAVYYGDDEVIKSDSGKYIVTAEVGKTVSVEYDAADFRITAENADGIYDLEVAETVLGAGEYVSGTVTAADGYTVTGVKVSYGEDKTVDVKFDAKTGKFNFTMPAGNVTVTAEYETIDYKVEVTEKTLADKGEVTLTVGGVAAEVFHVGDVVTVKTKVENGYKHTISVKDADGNSLLADGAETSTGKSIIFTMPAGDVSIEVSYQGRTYGITSNEAEYKNEDRDYTAPDGTELPTYSVAESASAGSEVVISTAGLGEKDSVQFVVTSLGEQLVDKDDNDETFTFDMPIGAVTIDVKFDIFVQEIADAQAVYAEAVAAAKAITDAEEPAYNAEAIAALNEVVTANHLDESDLRSKTAEEITAAAKAITDKIAAMDLEQAKAELRAIISGVPAADEYTEESYGAVTEAVAAANALLADDAEPTVEDLNAAGEAIKAAVEKLVTKLDAAKAAYAEAESAANAAIEAAGEYAADEVAALQEAMAAEATTAEEINAKTAAVKEATEALNKAVADEKAAEEAAKLEAAKAARDEAVAEAEKAIEAAGNYAADEVAALKTAIEEAKAAETAEEITAKTETVKTATAALNKAVEDEKAAENAKPVVTATAGDGEVVLTWTAPEGATRYAVYSYLNGKYYAQGTTTATTATVKNLTNGTKYGFLVRAYVNGAWSGFTTADNVYATPEASIKPVVTAKAGDGEVTLNWTALDGATRYAVYSYLNGKYYAQGTTTATTATVKNLTNGTKYGFLVRAYINGVWTSFTAADNVYATPEASIKPVVTAKAGDGKVTLNWAALDGATRYAVYSYLNGKYYAQGTTTATTYTVDSLTNGTKYGFLVRAYVNGAWTSFTAADNVYATPEASNKPVLTVNAGNASVQLTWTAPEGATRYAVYSYLNGKYYAQGTTTATTATVKDLTNGTKYGFLVRAYVNGAWTSFTSADIVYATPAVSSKPVLTVTARDGEAVLVWTAPAGATKYNVYSYLNGKYYAQGTTTATTSTIKNLTNGTKYGFLVRAFVNGAWTTFTSDDIVYATPAE